MPKKTLIKIFAIIAVAAIAFASFTSLGGDDTVSGTVSSAGLPSVTNNAGEAPTITHVPGPAPTTLQSVDIIEGTGAEVLATSTLTAHYTLMSWSTGEVLESSWTSGQPLSISLSGVIAGWTQGPWCPTLVKIIGVGPYAKAIKKATDGGHNKKYL